MRSCFAARRFPLSAAATILLTVGCNEGQKPTPLKRFDPSLVPAVEKKDKDSEIEKAKIRPPEKPKQ